MKMFRSSFTRIKYLMENSSTRLSIKSIILVGLVGCFLTSLAGVTGAMLLIFPHLVPTMTAHLAPR
ncbi:MAG: hypothetical protein EBT37_01260 [Betaproteobacteria bacterium]|nr:hypothetical protein [Betaproteobacteria bacterium]